MLIWVAAFFCLTVLSIATQTRTIERSNLSSDAKLLGSLVTSDIEQLSHAVSKLMSPHLVEALGLSMGTSEAVDTEDTTSAQSSINRTDQGRDAPTGTPNSIGGESLRDVVALDRNATIQILDQHGKTLYQDPPPNRTTNTPLPLFSTQHNWASARDGTGDFRWAMTAPSDANGLGIALAYPIRDQTGAQVGTVVLSAPLDSSTAALQELDLENRARSLAVIDPTGTPVVRWSADTTDPATELALISDETLAVIAAGEPVGAVYSNQNHQNIHVAHEPVEVFGQDWMLVLAKPVPTMMTSLASQPGWIWPGCLILAAVFIFMFAQQSRPEAGTVNAIRNALDAIAADRPPPALQDLQRDGLADDMAFALDRLAHDVSNARQQQANHLEHERQRQEALGNVIAGLKSVSEGRFDYRFDEDMSSDFKDLQAHLNHVLSSFRSAMSDLHRTTRDLQDGVSGVRSSAESLSSRTESQAATLEQTAAALDELSSSFKVAADSATNVDTEVQTAKSDAAQSRIIMSDAVEAMSHIQGSSDEISKIIGLIDDISFQTNLLALNAGVEAARAGEAGRGFAVVASEVRALAQRSSEAANQIKQLISQSREQVDTGVKLVGRTDDALSLITQRIEKISELMTHIATGSQEQATALSEINTGMSHLDQVTQQNASMVQTNTSATASLDSTVNALLDRLSGSGAAPPPAAKPVAAPTERPNPGIRSTTARVRPAAAPVAPVDVNTTPAIRDTDVNIRQATNIDLAPQSVVPIRASEPHGKADDDGNTWQDF